MKWFKHFSDNHRGQSIQSLLDEMGHTGLCYYLLVEMCVEKLESKPESNLTDADCLFGFHQRIVRQTLRISPANLRRLLGVCAANGLLSFEFTGNTLQISMPILLDLLEYDSKRARNRRKNDQTNFRLDIDTDRDIDKEEDRDTEPRTPCADESQFSPKNLFEFWNQNRDPLPEAEVFSDERKKKAKAQLKKYPDKDHWNQALAKFKASEFCVNKWKPSFDDFLSETKRIKALEGKYDDPIVPRLAAAQHEPSVESEWAYVTQAIKKFGASQPREARVWLGETRWGAVSLMGGWSSLCRMPDDQWTAKAGIRAIQESLKTGVSNVPNGS